MIQQGYNYEKTGLWSRECDTAVYIIYSHDIHETMYTMIYMRLYCGVESRVYINIYIQSIQRERLREQ